MATVKTGPSTGLHISGNMRDVIACVSILLSVFIFFGDAVFGGKSFLAESDNVAFLSFVPYLDQAKATGEFPLWVPYIFSGMPSLASFLAAGDRSWDIISKVIFAFPRAIGDLFSNDTGRLAMWYAIYGMGMYALMRSKKHRRDISTFVALAGIFSTWVITWVMIGHSTKPVSFASLPFILLALERIRVKFSFLNLFLLTLPMIVLVSATHPQMMFYIGCALALYLGVELVFRAIAKDNAMSVMRAGGALAIAGTLALATHADMFLATREYTSYSTRGSAPIVQSERNKQDQSGGNDYEYATNWSFSPEEMVTFFVPNYYGFGKMKMGPSKQLSMVYWGQMPFTDAANYMGIGVLLLAVVGAWWYRRDPFVVFLVILSAFSLLLSFGKNFPLLYDVFYNFVPTFNKFRAPSIALCLLQFATPVLAGYGLSSIVGWSENATKQHKKWGLGMLAAGAAFFLIGVVYTNMFEEGFRDSVAQSFHEKMPDRVPDAAQVPASATQPMFDEMQSDWMATGFLAILFGAGMFLIVNKKISPSVGMGVMIVLLVIDLWRVDKRGYAPSKEKVEKTVFLKTDVVEYIKQDPGVFRICDLSQTPANAWAYHFVENVHGYSSAKLRSYQDMFDVAGKGGGSMIANPFLWNLLNVKYIVSDRPIYDGVAPDFTSQQTTQIVYKNRSMLPRAFFTNAVVVEQKPMKILEALRDGTFDPRALAYLSEPVSGVQPIDSTQPPMVAITARGNQHLALKATTTAPNFLVVSEMYYPEWHATIDGVEVPIHKTDYLLRGIVVPPGTHNIEFSFISPAFERGRTISMAANGITLLIGAVGMAFWFMQRKKNATTPV